MFSPNHPARPAKRHDSTHSFSWNTARDMLCFSAFIRNLHPNFNNKASLNRSKHSIAFYEASAVIKIRPITRVPTKGSDQLNYNFFYAKRTP